MRPELERRVVSLPVTTRSEGSEVRLGGYASVFNTETVIAGLFREQIAPGAFAEALTQDDVRALFNHDPNFVVGRTTSGTLSLREDETGLAYDVVPPDTQWARDLVVSVGRGDISQSSFAFGVPEGGDEWTRPARAGELPLRTIRRATLYDVSLVTYPAYESTTTAVRSAAAAVGAEEKENDTALSLLREADRARFELALSASLTRI
jgi:HK97 family phage prohead protease